MAPPPRAATGEFLAQNLDLARLRYSQAQGVGKVQWSKMNGDVLVVVVVAVCCLLAKFQGRGV